MSGCKPFREIFQLWASEATERELQDVAEVLVEEWAGRGRDMVLVDLNPRPVAPLEEPAAPTG